MKSASASPEGSGERWFRLFSDAVLDHAFFTLDEAGRVASWNRGAERLFGYTAEEILGSPVERFYPEEARAREDPQRDLITVRQRGQFETESWRVRKDGGQIAVYVMMTTLRDADDAPSRFAVVTRNLTEQRRLLQELQDQRRRLQSIVNTAVDAVIVIDERGIVESFNPAGERMFGYKAEEVVGQNISMLMPEPYASEHTSYIQRYLRTGQAHIVGIGREVQARRKDGTLFPADLAVSEFYDGKPLFTGFLRDISDRKQLEAAVLQIAEAEQRRIGQELHDDTQQQLSGLTMIARNAADSLAPFVAANPKLADVQARFERVVKGLREANQSLRALARGLVPLQVEAHGLPDALARLATQISEMHAISCQSSVQADIDIEDSSVATHLYRIAQEAVNNSLKHGQAREITIALRRVDHTLLLEIADNGTGFGDTRNPRNTPGRGLQIMAYRAGLIGAVLAIRPREGGGTVVSCSLPSV